ncbi:PREDICTED: uncharacterized protein LOC106750003 isoform X2 [Dinoponera quadriceps]|uniref:Uncharacterized protein LOC106750003 isoform X2 n=1 Tax=Dinoponera quadriceps TaxID=609295 RepID=A0A6P3Y5X2_DINQU|nr:PREDICTED: uncharacterized protein LOC106750003 isoform X2 [Dinoponera quadriceps]
MIVNRYTSISGRSCRNDNMQDASQQNVTPEETTEKIKVENEVQGSVEESDSSEISEELSVTELEERREEIEKREQRKSQSHEETQKKNMSGSELSTVMRSVSSMTSDNDISVMSMSRIVANETKRQTEADEFRAGILTTDNQNGHRGSGHISVRVGEWNSLPILVERLREALELSLATGCHSGNEPMATSSLVESNVDAEVKGRLHTQHSMKQAMFSGYDHDDLGSKKDELKLLEDLLLLDIQTALSRLRETLEYTDVATLAKHGGVSDPTSKLQLLRLVSSLLSRLQVPQKETTTTGENKLIDIATAQGYATRKRRFVRHTIGVSAEEIAYARKQLEESSADLVKLNKVSVRQQQESLLVSMPCNVPSSVSNNASSDTPNSETHTEEICDKYTKNAINQRQSLRDKNKDCRGDIGSYRPVGISESNMSQDRRWCGNMDDEELTIERTNEEQSRVIKLAAILRQRAELVSANRCNVNNKFIMKKSKIKRANTVDIPSYLKLQAGGFDCDNSGCVQLRRPINVGDKVASNTSKNLAIPSFYPRTENDKKFLALINKNNEMQTKFNAASVFKSFGYTKITDMSSLTNENWNNRFSNIKTAFDKPSSVSDEIKLFPKSCPVKRFSSALHTSSQLTNKKTPIGTDTSSKDLLFVNMNISKPDIGFRHASSSLFQKIEKSQNLISPPSSHRSRFKDNASSSENAVGEKARIIFDRNSNAQSQSTIKFKIDDNESTLKHFFPRPPWIEHDRNGMKSSQIITENGRFDYRNFCKQFAPFIDKNNAVEFTKSWNNEEQRKRNKQSIQREIFFPSSKKLSMIDGKISETFSERESRVQQHHKANESCYKVEEPICDKFYILSEKNVFESIHNRQCNEQEISENIIVDATLSNSSPIAIQTGKINDNQPEEVRVFRMVPKVSRDSPPVCNDTSVQICNQSDQPLTDYIEHKNDWTTLRYECSDTNSKSNSSFYLAENPKNFILGHNWKNHTVAADVPKEKEILMEENTHDLNEEQSSVGILSPIENIRSQDISNYHSPKQHKQIYQTDNSQYENCFSPKLATENQSQIFQNYPLDMKFNRDPLKNEILSISNEMNKKNLSCMNNGDLPEEQNIQNQDISADAGVVTRYACAIATVASTETPEIRSEEVGSEFKDSSSPSPLFYRPSIRKTSNETAATKEEIRRHNILQQSLVRRLQNEHTMLNNQYTPVPKHVSNFNQHSKFQLPDALFVTSSPSTPSNSRFGTINRVTALREQYEQSDSQLRSVQKERSLVPNDGVTANGVIDSSDKYLVSCSNKSVKSTVLSKSESWHQLVLSNSHHPHPHPSHSGLPPTSSHLPKLPKTKSPSFFRTKKQYEASLSSDNMRKMEDKIRRYFDNSNDSTDAKDSKVKRFSSHDIATKGLVGLSRSRTMPGICDKKLHLLTSTVPQISATNPNSTDVDKVFDDIFEEATRTDDDHRF